MIPHSRPCLGPEEEEAACRVIRSGHLAAGTEVDAFESELADYLGVAHVIAVSSGSAALHISLLALNVGSGDAVAMPSYVCSALLNAAQHVGAEPVLADVDPLTLNLAPEDVARRLTPNTRAVFLPHMFGRAAPVQAFLDLGRPIIEDCATSLGARSDGRVLGSLGILSIFSFYATKVICAGEGGAIATSDPTLAQRARDLREYDGRSDALPRFNYKLTDVQAAIARVQLSKLDSLISKRRGLGERYIKELSDTSASLPGFREGEFPFRFVIRHERPAEKLIPSFEKRGIAASRPVSCPLHRKLKLPDRDFPNTAEAFERDLSIPIYPALSEKEVGQILQTALEIL